MTTGGVGGCDAAFAKNLEETNEVSLRRFLKSKHGVALEAKISLEVLGNLTDKALEGKLANQELGGLLELADLAKSNRALSEENTVVHARWYSKNKCTA